MKNRTAGAHLMAEKELMKQDRGSVHVVVEKQNRFFIVQWVDNKVVTLVSNYAAAEPFDDCKRYDRKMKEKIDVPRPFIIQEYNRFMGGVDLSDMLRSMYSKSLRCRRWYMYVFLYSLHLSSRNSWILYRVEMKKRNIKPLGLKDFILEISTKLIGGDQILHLSEILFRCYFFLF